MILSNLDYIDLMAKIAGPWSFDFVDGYPSCPGLLFMDVEPDLGGYEDFTTSDATEMATKEVMYDEE